MIDVVMLAVNNARILVENQCTYLYQATCPILEFTESSNTRIHLLRQAMLLYQATRSPRWPQYYEIQRASWLTTKY